MEYGHLEHVLSKRSKGLVHSLIISGTLNIALIATFITCALKERKEIKTFIKAALPPVKDIRLRNEDILKEFQLMPYDKLVGGLYNETHIESGQRRCDAG